MKRRDRSPEARGVTRQIATAKRDINTMLRSLKALEEGGGLTPQRKVPAKFQRVPFEGGAEGLLKDIEGTTAKQLGKAFGPAIGAKQLMAQMYRTFENSVPSEQADYAGFAAAVGMTLIYNLAISDAGFNDKDLKAARSAYTTEFERTRLITDALEKALAVNKDGSSPAASLGTALTVASGGQSQYPAAVFPFNTAYIKYMSSLIVNDIVDETKKCQFISENSKTMYAYLTKEPLPESVPTPNMIANAIPGFVGTPAGAAALKTWFTKHPEYDIDDTYEYVTRAVNAIGVGSVVHDIDDLNAIRKGVSKNFARLIDAVELGGLGTTKNISEINTLKDRLLECLKEKPSIDDIKDIRALMAQAALSTPVASVEAIGAYIITSVEIAELFASARGAMSATARSGLAGEFEAEEAAQYINNIDHLLDQYINLVMTPTEADAVQDWFESNFTAAGAPGRGLRTKDVSDKFKKLADDTFKEALTDINAYLNPSRARLFVEPSAQTSTVEALNGLLIGYVSADVFSAGSVAAASATTPAKAYINVDTSVTLLPETIKDLLNGNRLEIYDQANDDLFDSTTESLQALDDIADLNLSRKNEDAVNALVLHIASLLQVRLEALLPMALQDPSIRLRGNPAMSMLHKVGVGVGAYVGTNVVTSVAQRLVNKDGATSGGKYYAAEYAPAAVVGGVGAYLAFQKNNQDLGVPLIAGAAGSVLMRMAARKVDQNGAIYKYFLKYAGGAWVGDKLGDKTFASAVAALPTPARPDQADVDLFTLVGKFVDISSKAATKFGADIDKQTFFPQFAAAGAALQKVVVDPKDINKGLKFDATPEEKAAFTTAANAAIAAMTPAVGGWRGTPSRQMGASHSRSQAARSRSARGAMGRYVSSPVNPPVYQYEQPVRIPDSVMEQYVSPEQTGRIYAGAAGLDKMGKSATGAYFPTSATAKASMERMPLDHDEETGSQGLGRYFSQGVDMSRVNTDHDPEIDDMIEHLDAADPLTSEELRREGLSGYVSSTVVRATPASAMKLEEAGVAEIIKQSDYEPNTALIRVNDLGQPVTKEYNPSVAVNTDFGPQQINYSADVADEPSGLFTRGVFSAGFPKLR